MCSAIITASAGSNSNGVGAGRFLPFAFRRRGICGQRKGKGKGNEKRKEGGERKEKRKEDEKRDGFSLERKKKKKKKRRRKKRKKKRKKKKYGGRNTPVY